MWKKICGGGAELEEQKAIGVDFNLHVEKSNWI
jgi:hypothetical protein